MTVTYPYPAMTPDRTDSTPNITVQAADHDAFINALNALLVELGTNPSGAAADLSTRLTTIESGLAGLLDLRGDYNASTNLFPAAGGSGTAGAVVKADWWICSVAGTLGGVSVNPGDWIVAKIDTPGQTAANWSLIKFEFGYTPENAANKSNDTTMAADSATLYPTQHAAKAQTALQVLAAAAATKASATITPSASANTFGTASTVVPSVGPALDLGQVTLQAGGTVAPAEIVTVQVVATRSDASTATVTTTFVVSGGYYQLGAADTYALQKNGVSIVSLAFSVKSSIGSSAALVIYGFGSTGAALSVPSSTSTTRPYLSDSLFFNGIDPTGGTDASGILAVLDAVAAAAGYIQTIVIYEGQLLYVNPSSSLTCAHLRLEFRGGKVRVEPGKTFITNIQDPGLITIRNTRIQQLNITATGGTFILHGGSSTTSTGSSTGAITVSGLTSGTLQTAIQTLTGLSTATVTGSAGAFVVTFTTDLTNLTVDPGSVSTATGGTVVIRYGVFAPLNQAKWHPVWWAPVGLHDDTPAWTSTQSAVVAVQYVDTTGNKAGQWIEAPIGSNQFFGVRVKGCYVHADPGLSYFFPPNWDPQSGDMLILGDLADPTGGSYTTMDGGFWRTWNTGQAVNLITIDGARGRAFNQYIGGLAFGAVGIAAGRLGMAGTITPEVRDIRGVGNTLQRRINITATGGTVVFRGGAIGNYASQTGTTAMSGVSAATLQTAIRTLPGQSAATVASNGGGVYTATLTSLAILDVDPTLATGGTVTTSAYGTMVQVNSPDFRGHNIWGGSYQYMIYGKSGGGRVSKAHPWSCDAGITGDIGSMRGWHIESNIYLDTNNGWAVDLPGAVGTIIAGFTTHANGYYLGTGCIRIQKNGVACEDNQIKTGICDDDYGITILIDGAIGTDIDVTIRSASVRQLAQPAQGTYGVSITAASTFTKVRGHMRNSDFLGRAILNASPSSDIKLQEVRYNAAAQSIADYTDGTATYSTICGPIPYEAYDEWDFEYQLLCTGNQGSDGRVRINPSSTGTGMDGRMHTVNAPNSSATAGSATSLLSANTVRLNVTGAIGIAFGTLNLTATQVEQTIDGKGYFKAGTAKGTDDGNLALQVGSGAVSGASRAPADVVANGTTTLTSATAAFTAVDVGKLISEAGNTHIPAGTYIQSVTNGTGVVVNNVCSAGVGITATVAAGSTTFEAVGCTLVATRRA